MAGTRGQVRPWRLKSPLDTPLLGVISPNFQESFRRTVLVYWMNIIKNNVILLRRGTFCGEVLQAVAVAVNCS